MLKKSYFIFICLLILSNAALSTELDDAFVKSMSTCAPYTLVSGENLMVGHIKQIYGIIDNKCSYYERLDDGSLLECHYPLNMLGPLAEYYKSTPPSKFPSIGPSNQDPANIILKAVQKGSCKISH